MEENAASRDTCREVFAWLRGGDATPDPEMEDRFIGVLASMVRRRMEEDRERERLGTAQERRERRAALAKDHPLSLRHMFNEMKEAGEIDGTYEELMGIAPKKADIPHEEAPASTEEKARTSEFDSLVLAKAIRHMGELESHPLNMSQIQIILYISYGIWLASTGERLTSEHPQVWQFGPVFPRAYSRIRKDPGSGREEYETLRKSSPAVLEFLDRQFRRFGWTTAADASAPHTANGTPWAKARRRSPDRWGVPMEDGEIAEWFSERMQR